MTPRFKVGDIVKQSAYWYASRPEAAEYNFYLAEVTSVESRHVILVSVLDSRPLKSTLWGFNYLEVVCRNA